MGRKWFLAPLVIFALAGLKQTVTYWGEGYLDWAALSGILLFGLIYAGLVCLGAVITGLLKYAWGKTGEEMEKGGKSALADNRRRLSAALIGGYCHS